MELQGTTKTTASHLSSAAGKFSWDQTSLVYHHAGIGKMAANDPAEMALCGMASQLQIFRRLGVTNAGGFSQ
eukprot:9101539-Ditylum_brightwellii.AAC.1